MRNLLFGLFVGALIFGGAFCILLAVTSQNTVNILILNATLGGALMATAILLVIARGMERLERRFETLERLMRDQNKLQRYIARQSRQQSRGWKMQRAPAALQDAEKVRAEKAQP